MDRALKLFGQLIVYPHGVTDLWRYPWRAVCATYILAALAVALSSDVVVGGLFMAASALHFAGDGAFAAATIMTLVVLLSSVPTVAVMALFLYMAIIHLPRHYEAPISLPCAAAVLVAGFGFAAVDFDPSRFPRLTTSVVLGHATVNFWL